MILFWTVAALMIVAALLFILVPLLKQSHSEHSGINSDANLSLDLFHRKRRELEAELQAGNLSKEDFRQLNTELERTLLKEYSDEPTKLNTRQSKWLPLLILLCLPAFAVATYHSLGALDKMALAEDIKQAPQTPEGMLYVTERLEQSLDPSQPDPGLLFMVGRSYLALNHYPEAVAAFERLQTMVSVDSDVLAQLAQALYLKNGNTLSDRILALVKQALEIDPDNQTALGLQGIAAFESHDFKTAIAAWQRLLELDPSPEGQMALRQGIAKAREQLSEPSKIDTQIPSAPVNSGLDIRVALDGKLELPANATVFVFARAHQGGAMPLAALKLRAAELPFQVTLDDSHSVMSAPLSQAGEVDVIARVSLSGNVTDADYEAIVEQVDANQAEPVYLTLRPAG